MKTLVFSKFASTLAMAAIISGAFLAGCASDPAGSGDGNGSGGGGSSSGASGGGANTKEKAIPVTVGYSGSYTIAQSGEHWFKFEGTGETVIFETTGNVVDTYMTTYTESSRVGNTDDNSGEGSNALRSINTTSGTTYFIEITTRSNTSGTYTFVVTATTSNIRTNPVSVTTGYSSPRTIGSSDQHWFSFQGTGSNVIFETESNVVNTNIELYIGDNTSAILTDYNRISFSTVSGTTYYIKVTSRSGGTFGTYTFSVRSGTSDGSSMSYAIPVTVGYSSSHDIDRDGEHWFSFLGTGETVIFETTGNVVDTYMTTYTENSRVANNDDNSGEGSNALRSINTTSGTTYFIKITTRSNTSGTYTFVVRE
jgi:hypothetical protein